MNKAKKTTNLSAEFRADILWMLEPLVLYARGQEEVRFMNGNVFVEPAADGGAYVGAVCSHAMLIIHDMDAHCTEAMTLDVPYAMFTAAAPPSPVAMSYCGEIYLLDPPEWMQSGTCYAHSSGMFIHPKMRPPIWAEEEEEFWPCLEAITASGRKHHVGIDYRATAGTPADWRKPLKAASTKPVSEGAPSFSANPELLNVFDRAFRAAIDDAIMRNAPPPVMHFRLSGADEPIIVSLESRPDFIGCLMPTASKSAPATPWHFLKAPRSDAAGSSKTKSSGTGGGE